MITIKTLEPQRVAWTVAEAEHPEQVAWQKLLAWAAAHHLPTDTAQRFGFNNPPPAPERNTGGYEVWMTVEDTVPEGSGEVKIKHVPGVTCATLTVTGIAAIGPGWQQLQDWLNASPYTHAPFPCLEKHISPEGTPPEDFVMELYLPLA